MVPGIPSPLERGGCEAAGVCYSPPAAEKFSPITKILSHVTEKYSPITKILSHVTEKYSPITEILSQVTRNTLRSQRNFLR
jgi:hypothetical protein